MNFQRLDRFLRSMDRTKPEDLYYAYTPGSDMVVVLQNDNCDTLDPGPHYITSVTIEDDGTDEITFYTEAGIVYICTEGDDEADIFNNLKFFQQI